MASREEVGSFVEWWNDPLSSRAIRVATEPVARWQSQPSSGSADGLLLIIVPDLLITPRPDLALTLRLDLCCDLT